MAGLRSSLSKFVSTGRIVAMKYLFIVKTMCKKRFLSIKE